jgi:hypothetical protein
MWIRYKVQDERGAFMGAKPIKRAKTVTIKKDYTLWTSPRGSLKFPVHAEKLPKNADEKITKFEPGRNDKQIAPFRTPVTVDVLELMVD